MGRVLSLIQWVLFTRLVLKLQLQLLKLLKILMWQMHFIQRVCA